MDNEGLREENKSATVPIIALRGAGYHTNFF